MKTSNEDFRALFSLGRSADGDALRLWLECNLKDIQWSLTTVTDDVIMRHLQGRAQIIMEILQDLDRAVDVVRKTRALGRTASEV